LRPLLLVVAMLPHAYAIAATVQLAPEIEAFIQDMVQKHRFSDEALRKLFAGVEPNPAVISQISAPLTALPTMLPPVLV